MKKYLFILASLFYISSSQAHVIIPVPVTYQEHDQWCWAGCTACILHYYGDTTYQCEIAEYTRTVATWHNYGWTGCCVDPTMGCNYPNQNFGAAGSMQDILEHFDGITNTGMGALSLAQMDSTCVHYLPFIVFWEWVGGGGHFIVGNGVDDSSHVHYMNPWMGEGAHICTHDWMMYDGSHNYIGTNVLNHCPIPVMAGVISGPSTLVAGAHVTLTDTASGGVWQCSNAHATVSPTGVVTGATAGWDTVMYTVTNACGIALAKWPVHVTSTTGVDNIERQGDLELYPNPTSGSFTFQLSSVSQEPVHITITNVVGMKVMELSATTNDLVKINLDQPTGIYVLTAATVHGTYIRKISLNR